MNLAQLEYFRVLAKTEHYTKASQLLNITQPSLTHSIQLLERELNVKLFDKQGRQVKLNRYGRFFLERVDLILNSLQDSQEKLALMVDPSKGSIHFAYLFSLGNRYIPKIIGAFKRDALNGNIHFALHESTTEEIRSMLLNRTIDLALTARIDADGIESVPLFKEPLCVIVPKNHKLAKYDKLSISQISSYPLITYSRRSGIRNLIEDYFHMMGYSLNVEYEMSEDKSICGFVEAGLGIGIVPEIIELNQYDVVPISFDDPIYERVIYLSYRKDQYMSPPVEKFRDFILQNIDNIKKIRTF